MKTSFKRQRGVTLVELLVAIAVGMVITVAALYLYGESLRQTRNVKNVVEGADAAQLTLSKMADDIRSVNFLGCGRNFGNNVAIPALDLAPLTDFSGYFRGFIPSGSGPRPFVPNSSFFNILANGASVVNPNPFTTGGAINTTLPVNPVSLTGSNSGLTVSTSSTPVNGVGPFDALILVRSSPDVAHTTASTRPSIVNATSLAITTSHRIKGVTGTNAELFAIHSCSQADLFNGSYNNSTDSTINVVVARNEAISALLNKELRIDYQAGATVSVLRPIAYFVATSTNAATAAKDGSTLYQVELVDAAAGTHKVWGTPQPLVSSVRRFLVELGVDTDGDGEVNFYQTSLPANAVPVSVRITLEVLSEPGAADAAASGTLAAQNTVTMGGVTRFYTSRNMVVKIRNTF